MSTENVIVIKSKLLETRVKALMAKAKKIPMDKVINNVIALTGSAGVVHMLAEGDKEAEAVFAQLAGYGNAVMVNGPGGVTGPFRQTVLPVLYEIGTVIFWCSCVYGFYYIMRKNLKEGTARIKWAAIGYICLRCLEVFTRMVETVATNMLKSM